jgi:trans-2,3-dihydro-3-hydroxyanthranilate isomerase
MKRERRHFLRVLGAAGVMLSFGRQTKAAGGPSQRAGPRRFHFVHVDVFTSQPLLGNPLYVFTDARGLADIEMLALTRETYLNEATFVFPRDAATEREHGVSVRIFTPDGEIPFAGHPTLGTATVLRNRLLARGGRDASTVDAASQIILELKVGKIPVSFHHDSTGRSVGEMRQVPPVFGAVHDKDAVARLHNLLPGDISDEGPIQTVSTGLPFAILPLKNLNTLRSLRIDARKMNEYAARQEPKFGFYYVTRDTGDPDVAIRARCLYVGGEDAATGSAAGCAAAWMVRYGIAAPEQSMHIRQGVEMKRNSDIFVRASKEGEKIVNVRVGGEAIQTMEGEVTL